MELIDNRQGRTVEKEITKRINGDTSIAISTGMFSIYAFFFLREKFKNIKEIKILLLTKPSSLIPHGVSITTEDALWGTNEERELRRKLLLRHAAEECTRVLQKSEIKALITPNGFGFKLLFVQNDTNECVINSGTTDFNAVSLGILNSGTPQYHILQNGKENVPQLKQMFDSTWDNPSACKDVTSTLLSELQKGYKDYSPDYVYYFILHHLFHYSLVEFADDKIIKTKTGFKEKSIWNKLYKFQKDGVIGAIEKIEKYGGCIIADSVGLGKTFEALAIIKYYELRNDRVLVLCPKKLRESWTIYTLNDKRNLLNEDRFNFDVLNHTDLSRYFGLSGDINLETVNWSNYDLLVIDESHNFRNNPAVTDRETRYSRLMNEVIKSGVRTKVLMLSATPVNNRMIDLKNQIAFITEGDDRAFTSAGIKSISKTLRNAQYAFNKWQAKADKERNLE